MSTTTQWQNQDTLKLSTEQWLQLLREGEVFEHSDLELIEFVYQCPNSISTASEIAEHFHVHYNKVTAQNRQISKKLYHKFSQDPPRNDEGTGDRYWNVVFDGIPESPRDEIAHFYWKLRPNLVQALDTFTRERTPAI